MEETKPKKTIRRVKKAANSPVPTGPMSDMGGSVCGHSGCATSCQVRYVGPTTSVRDHHIMHAARGVTHVWTAAIVSGLAVVLTGAIAYTAVQAESNSKKEEGMGTPAQLARINRRLSSLEELLRKHAVACPGTTSSTTSTTP